MRAIHGKVGRRDERVPLEISAKQALTTVWNDCPWLVLMSSAIVVSALPGVAFLHLGMTVVGLVWLVLATCPIVAATLQAADGLMQGAGFSPRLYITLVRHQARSAIAWSAVPGSLVIGIVVLVRITGSAPAMRPLMLPMLLALTIGLIVVALTSSWALCLRVLGGLRGVAAWRVAASHLVDRPVVSCGQLSACVLSVIIVAAVPATAVIVPGILAVLTAFSAHCINVSNFTAEGV